MPTIGKQSSPDNENLLQDSFVALCQSRAYRYGQGELTLQDAVDWLQDWAFTRELVDQIGQDAVQSIMADAFRPYREDLL